MINKKNVLGKHPDELGVKDAIHTAIVSVRAGAPIKPGERVGMNEFNEAVPSGKGPGVADPFLKSECISKGENFWLLLNQDEIPNVQHVWEHPSVSFAAPTREAVLNKYLLGYAVQLGITYQQLMEAVSSAVSTDRSVPYPGTKTASEVDKALDEISELWSEWRDETGYEFDNEGSACCPEYRYPDCRLFNVSKIGVAVQ